MKVMRRLLPVQSDPTSPLSKKRGYKGPKDLYQRVCLNYRGGAPFGSKMFASSTKEEVYTPGANAKSFNFYLMRARKTWAEEHLPINPEVFNKDSWDKGAKKRISMLAMTRKLLPDNQ